jgi:DNA-binding protein HU-beta
MVKIEFMGIGYFTGVCFRGAAEIILRKIYNPFDFRELIDAEAYLRGIPGFRSKEGKIMNKGDLIRELAKVAGTKKEAGAAVNTILETITKALKKGNKVTLIGFGTYSVTKRAARKGRNPQTGKEMKIAARKVPKFTPVRV